MLVRCAKRLFVPQSKNGIYAHRPSCWNVTSNEGDEHEQDGYARKGFEIYDADSIEQARHQAREAKSRSDADGDSSTGKFQALANDQPKDVAAAFLTEAGLR